MAAQGRTGADCLTDAAFTGLDLYHAAVVWQDMLAVLAAGKAVSEAIVKGNADAKVNDGQHEWKVIPDGGGNVKIR